MISQSTHIPVRVKPLKEAALKSGTWLVILHAQRIPPHVGLMFNENYNSITIKNHEYDIRLEILLKTIRRNKIKSLFVQLAPHPVFSVPHQLEMFKEQMKDFGPVEQYKTTCTSPIKDFLREFYAVVSPENELFFELMQKLYENDFLKTAYGVNVAESEAIELPVYTTDELNEKIKNERKPYYND